MKTYILTLIAITCFSVLTHAQSVEAGIRAQKEEYINTQTGFSKDETTKFWALYDEMETRRKEIKRSNTAMLRSARKKGLDNLTDEELKKLMDERLTMEQSLQDLRKEYHQKFIDLIGIRKTAKYYEAELAWKKELIRRFRELRKSSGDDE